MTKQETEEHERTRNFYRSWCDSWGTRGRKSAHMRRVKDEDDEAFEDIPRIAMDHFFVTDKDMHNSSQLQHLNKKTDPEMYDAKLRRKL